MSQAVATAFTGLPDFPLRLPREQGIFFGVVRSSFPLKSYLIRSKSISRERTQGTQKECKNEIHDFRLFFEFFAFFCGQSEPLP
jgi:hypothetical protein